MIFIKNLWLDIKCGIIKKWYVFMLPCIISVGIFYNTWIQILKIGGVDEIDVGSASLGDYLFSIYGGMNQYIPSPSTPFEVPVIWLVVFVISSFLVMNYAANDLKGVGKQIIVRAGKRPRWWLSKCIWNILLTAIYHLLMILTMVVMCLIYGIPLKMSINIQIQKILYNISVDEYRQEYLSLSIMVFILPVLVSITVNLFQMFLTIYTMPIYSFLISCIIYLASAYLMNSILIGNYAMMVRYGWLMENSVPYKWGYTITVIVSILIIIFGRICFKKKDLLNGED